MKKKILALLLCLTMVLSLLPSVAFADGEEDGMTEAVAELLEQPETEEEASEEEVSAPVEEETEELAEETEEAEEEFPAEPRRTTGNEGAPDDAVAYVTDAEGNAVGSGDDFDPSEKKDYRPGYYLTLPNAISKGATNAENTYTITLLTPLYINAYDFTNRYAKIDLAGFTLSGAVRNATNVTIVNSGATQNTLAATGTYSCDVSGFVAEGFEVVENTTVYGTSAVAYVTVGDNPVGAGDVDSNGDNEPEAGKYATLDAAIAACESGVETKITMVDDQYYASNAGATVPRGKNIILDLAGKTIATYEPNAYTSYTILNNGTLTITDSSATLDKDGIETAAGTGLIGCYATSEMQDTAPSPGYATNTITNKGTLNFYAGTVINQTMDGTGGGLACYCVDNQTSGVPDGVYFNMYAGEMQSYGGSVAVRMNLNGASMTNKNVVNMQGGTIGSLWVQTYGKDEKDSAFELTLNNATVLYNVTLGMSASTVSRPVYSKVTITDSIFGSSFSSSLYVDDNNTVSISGLKAKGINMTHPEKLLSDGYFMDPVADGYIVDTYHCNPNTDEVYNLDNKLYNYVIDQRQVEQENAFKVIHKDGTEESFVHATDAATAVKADGETIQVLKDTNEKIVAPTGKSVIIDLNGKTVSNYVKVYGGAEFIDSSEVKDESGNIVTPGTGKIVSDYGCVVYDVGYNNGYIEGKTLKFTSGTFISHEDADGVNSIVLNYYNYDNNIVVDGGTFITDEGGSLVQEEYSGTYLGGLTINGGYIDTLVEAQTCELVINGGEITGYVYQYLPDNYGSSMEITGGTMGTVYAFCLFETVDISGGHIKGDLQSQARYDMTISGDTVIDGDVLFATYGLYYGGLTIDGGTFKGNITTPWYSQNGITITNGTFNGTTNLQSYTGCGDVAVSGGTFNGMVNNTVYDRGQMAITGGTFNDTVKTWTWAEGGSSATHDPCITGGTFDVVNNCTPYKLYVDSKNNVYHKDKVNFIDYETIYTTVGMLTKLGYTYEVTNTSSGYVSDGNGNAFWTQELTFTKGSNTKVFYVKYNADGYSDSDRLLKSTNCVKEDYILQESPYDKLDVWQAKGVVVNGEETEGSYKIYYGYLPTDTTVLYPDQKAIGYTVLYNGGDTFTLKPFEIKVDPTTIETKLDDGSITATEGNLEDYRDKESAKEAIVEMMDNSAVGNFVETKIDENTGKISETVYGESFNISMVLEEAMKAINEKEGTDKATVTDNGEITVNVAEGDGEKRSDVDLDKQIIVSLEAAQVEIKTEEGQSGTKTTMINESTYDVTPMVTIKYTNGDGEETTVTTKIPNEAITAPITFRLPIDSKTKANYTKVYHSDDATNFKKELVNDKAPIQTDPATGERYVELSASSFSYYTCENINALIESNVVAIRDKDGTYYGFDKLDDAIAAFNEGDGTTATGVEDGKYDSTTPIYNAREIILLKDTASSDFKDKQITLDLNGCVLSGTSTNAEDVTVANSSTPKATLAAIGVYKNNVLEFVADGYYVKTTNVANDTVYVNTDPSNYTIEVITSTTTDRDSSNNDPMWEVTGGDKYATEAEALAAVTAYQKTENGKWYLDNEFTGTAYDTEAAAKASQVKKSNTVDVYADDTVTVKVVVNGARFTAADVTLTWDKTMFTDTTNGRNLPQGWIKGTGDNDNTYRFTSPKGSDSYYNEDNTGEVLGTFTFKANYLDEATIADASKNPGIFTVVNADHPAKVIGGWGVTLEDSSTQPVPEANLKDDTAKILLMNSMVGAVEGKTNLIYKGSNIEQKLLNDKYNDNKGWSAKVAGNDVDGAKIQYCVLTAEEVANGVTPGSEGHAYSDWTGGNTVPTKIDADTYTVYYRIKADGYETVEGSREVTIAKQPVTLTWTAPTNFTGSYTLFEGNYKASGFSAPTAKFSNLDGSETTLTAEEIKLTSGSEGMKDVGSYVFTAVEPKNYSFTNPTANVKVNGLDITGWKLTATNAADGTPTVGVIFRDGESYTIGALVIAEGASIVKDGEGYKDASGNAVTNVNIVYEYFEGKYYKEGDTIPEGKEVGDEIWTVTTDPTASPKYSALGEYKLRMTVTADNYEKLEQEVTFTIKNPIFKYETTEYVAGYTLILVYTNETGVTFKYDTQQMYDETIFGYRWHNTESYSKVYGIVIKGNADESKILASNVAAESLGLPNGYDNTADASICDVNNKTTAQVNLDDMTAVQSIYNVNAGNMLDMQLVLRSDVNRDKKVDTIGDVAKVMAYYLTLN